jgi:hypothetical protein
MHYLNLLGCGGNGILPYYGGIFLLRDGGRAMEATFHPEFRIAVRQVFMARDAAAVCTALLDFIRGPWFASTQEAMAPVLIHHVFPGDGDA